MRTIKFRAWDGEYMHYNTSHLHIWMNDNKYEIMQFTGLLDKNGKEIYEGDLIKIDNDIEVVEWGSYSDGEYVDNVECWMISLIPLSDAENSTYGHNKYDLEVIGNIYQNNELLSH